MKLCSQEYMDEVKKRTNADAEYAAGEKRHRILCHDPDR